MTITALLRRQHAAFRKYLKEAGLLLDTGSKEWETQLESIFSRLVPELIVHERIETELLFPALRTNLKNVPPDLLDLYASEHISIREKCEDLKTAVKSRDGSLRMPLIAEDFISLLKEHMEQEEETLFPIIERDLSPDIQAELHERANALQNV